MARGVSPELAVGTMRRNESYDPEVLDALAALTVSCAGEEEVRELPIGSVAVGMVIADDIHMTTGTLLVARGYEVTASFVARARQFRPGTVKEPVRVVVRRPA
jgi:hypothetical protein